MAHFIAIAGNIGCGKSSLTTLLAQRFGWLPYYEIVESNPYLVDFYSDMKRWSFHLQMFFLTKRFRHQQEIARTTQTVVQDRTIYEDAEIFAKNLYLHGKMDERDYRSYAEHFSLMTSFLKVPDLLIYLRADLDALTERIAIRGRDYEKSIPRDYLQQLNNQYESWIQSYQHGRTITIDVSKIDFVNHPKDLDHIASIVSWELECINNASQTSLPLKKNGRKPRANQAGRDWGRSLEA